MKKRDEILVGLLMTVAIIVAIVGSLWLARGGLSRGYPLYSVFPWSAGLKQGQQVLLGGVNIGYVDELELRNDGTVVTTYRIGNRYQVPEGTVATVVPYGIFGDMAIALTPQRPNPVSIQPGDTVPVGPTAPGLADLTARADSIARSVHTLTTALEREIIESGGLRDLRRAMAGTNQLVAQFSSIAAEQNRQLSATLASFRRTAEAVDPAKVDSTLESVQQASANMNAMSAELRETTERLNSIVAKVDSGPGTAAMLVNDPGVYNDVRALLQRIDSLTTDFQRNPRKYINLSIF